MKGGEAIERNRYGRTASLSTDYTFRGGNTHADDFVEMVEDQSGGHIDPMHAERLIHHAQMVIMGLQG